MRGRVFTVDLRAVYTADAAGTAGAIVEALLAVSPEFAEVWRRTTSEWCRPSEADPERAGRAVGTELPDADRSGSVTGAAGLHRSTRQRVLREAAAPVRCQCLSPAKIAFSGRVDGHGRDHGCLTALKLHNVRSLRGGRPSPALISKCGAGRLSTGQDPGRERPLRLEIRSWWRTNDPGAGRRTGARIGLTSSGGGRPRSSAACWASCTFADPTAGEADARRETRRSRAPPRCSGRFSAMNGHAPWFAGSSCTQTTSARPGSASQLGLQLVGRQRVELLDPHDRDVGAAVALAARGGRS